MLRLLIVAENRAYRDALVLALSSATVIVIGAVSSPEEALPLVKEGAPDVILLGVPGENGRAALRTFLLMDRNTRVVPMEVPADPLELVAWAEAGAAGFVMRDSSLDELRLASAGYVERFQ